MHDPSDQKRADIVLPTELHSHHPHPSLLDDPAVAIGLALRWARSAIAQGGQGASVPVAIASLLLDHVAIGNATSVLVADWLAAKGFLATAEGRGR